MTAPFDLAEAMATVAEQMAPVVEMCEGQRKQLEARGWSLTAAEAYALELLLGITRLALSGGRKAE